MDSPPLRPSAPNARRPRHGVSCRGLLASTPALDESPQAQADRAARKRNQPTDISRLKWHAGVMNKLRVTLIADDPLARAGLASLLAGQDDCRVVDQFDSSPAQLDLCRSWRPGRSALGFGLGCGDRAGRFGRDGGSWRARAALGAGGRGGRGCPDRVAGRRGRRSPAHGEPVPVDGRAAGRGRRSHGLGFILGRPVLAPEIRPPS